MKTYDQALYYVLRFNGFPDPTWVSFHIDALTSTALPVLEALIPSSASHENECLLHEWVVAVVTLIEQAVRNLQDMSHVVNTLFALFSVRDQC